MHELYTETYGRDVPTDTPEAEALQLLEAAMVLSVWLPAGSQDEAFKALRAG